MKKAKKYNIIIYSTLTLGILLLVIGGVQFFKNPDNNKTKETTEEKVLEQEPEEMKAVDKESIIHNYLTELVNQNKVDDLINYDSIKTWQTFRLGNVEFQRTIAFNYYEYKVDIIIENPEAILPVEKNKELSNQDIQVITVRVDLFKDSEIIVKNIDEYK